MRFTDSRRTGRPPAEAVWGAPSVHPSFPSDFPLFLTFFPSLQPISSSQKKEECYSRRHQRGSGLLHTHTHTQSWDLSMGVRGKQAFIKTVTIVGLSTFKQCVNLSDDVIQLNTPGCVSPECTCACVHVCVHPRPNPGGSEHGAKLR